MGWRTSLRSKLARARFLGHDMTTISIPKHVGRLTGPAVLALLFTALAVSTWGCWPDLLIDFGRELYVPWRLAEGSVLYRDIAYFNGPLSPYFNSWLFRVAGTSFRTITSANLVLALLLVVIVYRQIVRWTDRLTATLACSVMLIVFLFAHLVAIGGYNFISPYSHELTHGMVLSVLALSLMTADHLGTANWKAAAAGVCWGGVVLGKPEVLLALTGGIGLLAVGEYVGHGRAWRGWLGRWAVFCLAGCGVIATAALLLATRMPLRDALLGVAGGWRWMVTTDVQNQVFYRAVTGLNEPWLNLGRMALSGITVAMVLVAVVLIDRSAKVGSRRSAALASLLVVGAIGMRGQLSPMVLDPRVLPLAMIALTISLAALILRSLRRSVPKREWIIWMAWALFALLMLSKMLLAPRFRHYGFALAMPATVLCVVLLVYWLPPVLCRRWRGGRLCMSVLIGLCIVDLGFVWHASEMVVRMKGLVVGSGADRIHGYDAESARRDVLLARTVNAIKTGVPADATMLVLPEGVMLNYLTRRSNPTPYINFMPPELEMFGQRRILHAMQANPPDFVVIAHKDTTDYGVRFFGSPTYGQQIMQWVNQHYHVVEAFGAEPLKSECFGVELLERNAKHSYLSILNRR